MTKIITQQEAANYWKVMREAMFDTKLKGMAPSLLWYISNSSFPSFYFTQANLAKELGVKRRAIMHAVASLEKNGYVTVDRPPRGSHKTLTVTLKDEYKAPTQLIVGYNNKPSAEAGDDSSCPLEVHDMSAWGTRANKKVEAVMSTSGTHTGDTGNILLDFENKPSHKSHKVSNSNGYPAETVPPENTIGKIIANSVKLEKKEREKVKNMMKEHYSLELTDSDIDFQSDRAFMHYGKKFNKGLLMSWLTKPNNYNFENKNSQKIGHIII